MKQQQAPLKIAIVGFRHGHIYDLVARVQDRADVALVAICEEHRETREEILAANISEAVFDSYQTMLDTVPCDAIGVGDYYARRGSLIIEALRRGKHVISDKPLCISVPELDEIETLARERSLRIGCQLDARSSGPLRGLRRLIRGGEIGEVHAISFNGQHPLMYGTRPGWYFEEGKHGGTINDLAIHALDFIPWLTGRQFFVINAARNWNARLPQVPHFKDAAQMMLTLDNGGGVLGDVSYITPDSFSYSLPQYWQTIIWGADGMVETSLTARDITLYKNGETEPRRISADPPAPGLYLESFLREIQGETAGLEPATSEVLRASRVALLTQQAADERLTHVELRSGNHAHQD